MLINILFLTPLFIIGIMAVRQDIKYRKISNQLIIFGLITGFVLVLLLIIWNFIAEPITNFYLHNLLHKPTTLFQNIVTIQGVYIQKVIVNLLISILVGYFIWKLNFWGAGDAKLFIVYSFLLPLTFYWRTYFPYFPAINLLLNIFTLAFVYYLGLSVINFSKKSFLMLKNRQSGEFFLFQKKNKTKSNNLENIILIMVLILIINFTCFYAQTIWHKNMIYWQLFLFCLLIVFNKQLLIFFKNNIIRYGLIGIFFIALFVLLKTDFQLTLKLAIITIISMLIFMPFFFVFNYLIVSYLKEKGREVIEVNDIKANMVLSDSTNAPALIEFYNKKLNDEQAIKIKTITQKLKIQHVVALSTPPFAQWLFLGAIITIIFHGSILCLFINFIMKRHF